MDRKFKIVLGDLRHNTTGRHSIFIPIGIGYIASYMISKISSDKIDIRLYDEPNSVLKDIDEWKPDIIGLSNYCWNAELSKLIFSYAKEMKQNIICISGGPEFPLEPEECRRYLLERGEIDFYIYRESEIAFTKIIQKILENHDINELKSKPNDGIMSINPKTNELVLGDPIPRIMELDTIPSPYLNGLMDKWFDGYSAPAIETARGCPYSCEYCSAGHNWFNKIAMFSVERVNAELTYMAKKMKNYPNVVLGIWDTNFGMYSRDVKIAEHLKELQDKYGWPNAFTVTTGKSNYDKILYIASLLKNKMYISSSVQSLNPKTLEVIKRKNLPLKEYLELQKEIKNRGMPSDAELILPMPEETKESFFQGIKILSDAGIESITTYTTMLLKGARMASEEMRNKYSMVTKFRLVPRQFGEYRNKKCFEVEEICVATNKMLFEDYLECRGFALISSFLSNEQFDVIRKHITELEINFYDFVYFLWLDVKSGNNKLSQIYNEYIDETKKELWNSKEGIFKHFSLPENYQKLLKGELGDNLMRKYKTKMLIECCILSIEIAYSNLNKMTKNTISKDVAESLDAAKMWVIAMRDVSSVFRDEIYRHNNEFLNLPYDLYSWYQLGLNSGKLISFKRFSRYEISCDFKNVERIFEEGRNLYGDDFQFIIGRLLINWNINNFWRNCKPI